MLVRAARSAITVAGIGLIIQAQTLAAQQPAPAMPKTHTVKRGDTLWDLAKLYLGDSYLWPEIYRLNTDQIEDPHWIYPGEVLKLPAPAAQVVAVTPPPPAVAPTPRPVAPPPTLAPTPHPETTVAQQPVHPAVRIGEYVAAPWIDRRDGPRGYGYIIETGNISGIAPMSEQSRMNLYDPVMIAPPTGDDAAVHKRYLTYVLGPLIEDLGQVIIPTGIIEVTRTPTTHGEAAVGRVMEMFGEVTQGQRMIPYDTTAALVYGRTASITNGHTAKVRWISSQPVLPRLQNYVILDMSARDGVNTGDEIELFLPRQKPNDEHDLTIPEVYIARAQVLRVTPYATTAIITAQEQPKIEEGTAARLSAKIQ